MATLEAIVKQHDQALRAYAVNKFGANGEDFLNDAYLRLHAYDQDKLKSICEKGVIKFVLIRIIGQVHIDYIRQRKELPTENIIKQQEISQDYFEKYWNALEKLDKNVIEETFLTLIAQGQTIREISINYDISYDYVWHVIKQIRVKCEELVT